MTIPQPKQPDRKNHEPSANLSKRLYGRVKSFLVMASIWGVLTGTAFAQSSYALFATTVDSSRPAPTMDGVCSTEEYRAAWRLTRLIYRPQLNFSPAQAYLLTRGSQLFVCLTGLPGPDPQNQFSKLSLHFDSSAGRGPLAGTDALRLERSQAGVFFTYRGDGAGNFVRTTSEQGIRTFGRTDGNTWTVEFQIPLDLIGGGAPGSTISFQMQHEDVGGTGTTVAWPPGSRPEVPDSWATLYWFSNSGVSYPEVDLYSINQGLSVDANAGVETHLIADKETVVHAQLFTRGAVRQVSSFQVRVTRISPDRSLPVIVNGRAALSGVGGEYLADTAQGSFHGTGEFAAWLPRTAVNKPGEYLFESLVSLEGQPGPPQVLVLGTKTFLPTGDLRLLVQPWRVRFLGDDTPWTPAHTANVPVMLRDTARMYPLRAGVGVIGDNALDVARRDAAGIRFRLVPITSCLDSDTTAEECDHRTRSQMTDRINFLNAYLDRQDRESPLPFGLRERFDYGMVCTSSSGTGGGQAQTGWTPPSPGVGFDASPTGGTSYVIAQEVAHCLGQVEPDSPNSMPGNAVHSMNQTIPLWHGEAAAHLINQNFVQIPQSALYGTSAGNVGNIFMEGFEWNRLHDRLLRRVGLASKNQGNRVQAASGNSPAPTLFHLMGRVDRKNAVTAEYSQRVDDLALPLTPEKQGSPWHFLLLDKTGKPLNGTGLSFAVEFDEATHHHDDPPSEWAPLQLTTILPEGTRRIEIRNLDRLLYSMDVTDQPPGVSNVVAKTQPDGNILLTWEAADEDSATVCFSVFYLDHPGGANIQEGAPILLMTGLQEKSFTLSTELLAATEKGTLRVVATDGFNTAQAESNPFSIIAKPPFATISGPVETPVPVGRPVRLIASAFDLSDGMIGGASLEWRDEKGAVIGTGESVETTFKTEGSHEVSLSVKASSGLSARTKVQINVIADADGDGLPNAYEQKLPCLSDKLADSFDDIDNDGLSSLQEFALGTDPCDPDSDGDGVSDGDEVRLGSNPLDAKSLPRADTLFVSPASLQLKCDSGATVKATLNLRTAELGTAWHSGSDASWLTATPQGEGGMIVDAFADSKGLPDGIYTTKILFQSARGQSREVPVTLVIGKTDTPPQIGFQTTASGEIVLSWMISLLRLEATETLQSPKWIVSEAIPEQKTDHMEVTIKPDQSQKFFRLVQ